jgi:hypothetical protein
MKIISRAAMFMFFAAALATVQFWGIEALAQSTYFAAQGCNGCHSAPVVATCNGCHHHGPASLKGVSNKTSYAPGETVSVTITGGNKSGWFRAVLYDQNTVELARSTGNDSGMGSSATYPATLTAPAPATAGTYTWKVAWYGNQYDTSSLGTNWAADANNPNHGEVRVSINSFTVAAAAPPPDTTAPVVSTFTIPATATSLTVPVSSLTATDNVGVTGYMITTSAVAPTASAAGWSATAPASVTASASGSVTFYAWTKDAAGNVSAAKSAMVSITLPPAADTTAPVVGAFTLPATATSLTVPVSSLTATDAVGVTGYMVTTSAVAPTASAAGWSASAPASVSASAPGSMTFYAWAKDAAGNVSAAKSATVAITLPSTAVTLTVSTLADGSYTNNATLNITGNAGGDAAGIKSVTVNGTMVTVMPSGVFTTALTLNVGANPITIVANGMSGGQKSDTRTINYDPNAPVLTVSAPVDNSATNQSFITISGTVNESSTVTVALNNGSPQTATVSGNSFSASVYLVPGVNTISISATDLAGNVSNAKRTVTYDNSTGLTLAITNPAQDITTSNSTLVLLGTVTNSMTNVKIRITMGKQIYNPVVRNGIFRQQLTFTSAKLYTITITASDASGNSSTVKRNVIYRPAQRDHGDD